MPQKSHQEIPLYASTGNLRDWIDESRLVNLQSLGLLARVVRHRKGLVSRAILLPREGDPAPLPLTAYMGTKHSFRERLSDGHVAYRLRSLGDRTADEHDLAPGSVRPIFLRVLLDCMVDPADTDRVPADAGPVAVPRQLPTQSDEQVAQVAAT